jgi:hypothetical protein
MLSVVGENWEFGDFLSDARIHDLSKSSIKTVIFLDKCGNNHGLRGSS